MDPVFRPVLDPRFTLAMCGFLLAGIALGTVSGLVPGLHANNFALLLAGIAPAVPHDPLLVGVTMLAAGVVHTFLDIVPALSLGVPDASMAIAALPGHRLVIAGRGREALRLSAAGSALAVALAVPLAVPVTWAMVRAYPTLRANLWLVLGFVVAFLIATEPSRRAAAVGFGCFLVSGGLGSVALDVDPAAPLDAGGMLVPLLTGLFGAPILLEALRGEGVPPQADARITMRRLDLGTTAAAGSVAGAVVGYLPGISAAIAAVLALPAVPNRDVDRGFVVATSGAGTSNTVFALFALVAIGRPRTGVMVGLERLSVPLALPVLLVAVAAAALAGFSLVLLVGDAYLRTVGRMDYTLVSGAVIAFLLVLSFLFAGAVGVGAFAVSTVIGLVPPRFGARRVHLMGVLMIPIGLGL